MNIKFKKLNDRSVLPKQVHDGDAGFDLHACLDEDTCVLVPGEIKLIQCGFSMELPVGTEAQIRPRSGLALKYGVTVINSPGTIDRGYTGPVGVILVNFGKEPFTFSNGSRIAQMIIAKVMQNVIFEIVGELSGSERGESGFGSSGI